ncbi:polysaccharide deacetylase family protein [Persicitalea jodogahamensis]|uniref:Polysaccharide deacetylase n=1 Tax=Persicitalea jodogahamensis TaxID=402147 RepID=A0A8J3D6G7_9BACT|nr:polysaccharide deacetylase family protein [Persicitalea jodogahamensis]GHB81295.1 polysaccharide deacetylase [Persicitalea jodogahamensis]
MPAYEKALYLTFDDGPIPEVTEFVLDALEKYQAKGTFFCIGDNVRKHPHIFNKISAQGHTIGNHTFNHLNGWRTTDEDYLTNILQCDEQLPKATGLFRPPYGRIKQSQARRILPSKKIVMWDVLTGDFSPNISPDTCFKKTVKYSRSGSIILFHDSLKARKNMEYALPLTLDYFKNKGYKFLPL